MIPALLLLLAAQAAPPLPPPPPEQLAAAIALWSDHPIAEEEHALALANARWDHARALLAEVRILPGKRGWLEKQEALYAALEKQLAPHRSKVRAEVAPCLATPLAYRLSTDALQAARAFFSTTEGRAFWNASGLGTAQLQSCYASGLQWVFRGDDALRAIGLTPPKRPDPGSIVY